jgi:PAS domain S-box-containing protein
VAGSAHFVRSISDLAPGDHLCCLYGTDEEHRAVLSAFLRAGLDRGEKVVYVADARLAEAVAGYLRDERVEVQRLLRSGQLAIVPHGDPGPGGGDVDPARRIALLRAETERAVAEGYPALRVAAEMTWAVGEPAGKGRLIEYEARLNEFFEGAGCLAACLYDRRRLPAEVLLDLLYTHPAVAVGTKVYENFYYVPPAELLRGRSAAVTFEKVLENLVRQTEAQEALSRRREQLESLVAQRASELTAANEQLRREAEERGRVLESLNAERDFSAAVLDTAGALVIVLDAEGRIVRFNHACERVTGYASDEVRGRYLWDLLVAPKDLAAVRAVFGQLRAGQFPNRYENDWVTKSGQRRLIAWSNTGILNRQGRVEYVIGTGIDVTEHRQAEAALRHSEERYRLLVELMPDAIFVQCEGNIAFVNSAGARMLGADSPDRIVGRPVLDFIHPDFRATVRERLGRYPEGVPAPPLEEKHLRLDGTEFDAEAAGVPFTYAGKPAALVMVRDISNRKRAEAALRESEERLRQAQKMEAIGRLAGGIAHDFNNQLTVVTGYCDILLREMRPDDPLRAHVEEILRAAGRSETLTSRLLTFSRCQIMHPQVVNLNAAIADLRDLLGRVIGEDICLKIHFGDKLGNVRADRALFEQALINLVVNARDAMPSGGTLTLRTTNERLDESYAAAHADVAPGPYVGVAVNDTGVGMDKETLAHIFDPFFTTKPVGKGTGLGLPMVYGFIRQSGGHIVVYSEPGRGTAIRLYLPRVDAPADAPPAPGRPAAAELAGTETVLLVEDDPAVRGLVARVLTRRGYTVVSAAAPGEALALAGRTGAAFDLLITDIVMPGMSGGDLARELGARWPGLRVLFMSGYTEDAILQHGLADGGATVLTKPFGPDALAQTVRRALDAGAPQSS